MKRLIPFALICGLILVACLPHVPVTDSLNRSWKLEEARNEEYIQNRTDKNSILLDSICKRFASGYLSLYGDNRYTFIGKYVSSIGWWRYDKTNETIVLDSFVNSIPATFRLKGHAEKWMVLIPTAFGTEQLESADIMLMFEYDPHFESDGADLISNEHNEWRMRPSRRESRAEIRTRVKKHVDFLVDYYLMAEKKSRTYFEPMYMQTAVRFCRDGVGVESEAHLTQPWINCFYDRDDAL
ncbi:MAG: hypothetical protein JWO03_1819, partial [Bacteroidetes bacterium]|nr:hypothetical protein [Bacteroidota bacterium]